MVQLYSIKKNLKILHFSSRLSSRPLSLFIAFATLEIASFHSAGTQAVQSQTFLPACSSSPLQLLPTLSPPPPPPPPLYRVQVRLSLFRRKN